MSGDEKDLILEEEDDESSPEEEEDDDKVAREARIKRNISRLKGLYGREGGGQLLALFAYLYCIILGMGSILGPLNNLWVPQFALYTFYPMGVLIGAYIGYLSTQWWVFLPFQFVSSLFGFMTSLTYIIEHGHQLTLEGGMEGVIYGETGTTPIVAEYPPVNSKFFQTGDFSSPTSYNYGYINFIFVLNCINFVICLTTIILLIWIYCKVWKVKVLNGKVWEDKEIKAWDEVFSDIVEEDGIETKFDFKLRIFLTGVSGFFTFVFLLGYSMLTFIQATQGWVLMSVFSNANVCLLMMLTWSIYIPMGDKMNDVPGYVTEEEQRYVRGVNGHGVNYFFGWIISFIIAIWAFSVNGVWRGKNSLSAVCGGNYAQYLGNTSSPGEGLVFFGWQTVIYQPISSDDITTGSITFTCMDDVVTLVIFSICFAVACFSLCVVFYSVRPLRKDIRDEKFKELKQAKQLKTIQQTREDRRLKELRGGGPKKRLLWGLKKTEKTRGLGFPLNWVPKDPP